MIYITSDWHLKHRKLLAGEVGVRPKDYEELLISNYTKTVADNDICIFLGDMLFQIPVYGDWFINLMRSLPGNKILVKGNHDTKLSNEGFMLVYEEYFTYRDILFSHYPVNHNTIKNKHRKKMLELSKVFNERNFRLNFHGHSHEFVTNNDYCINTCPEHNNYTPLNITEIISNVYRAKDTKVV